MNRSITTLIALTGILGLAGCAGAVSPSGSAASPVASASSPYTLNSSSTAFQADDNPVVPGATGRAVVSGDNSSIAGDETATELQRTGMISK